MTADKIRLATSTKYLQSSLIDWIKQYKFNSKYGFEILDNQKSDDEKSALLRLKKTEQKVGKEREDI